MMMMTILRWSTERLHPPRTAGGAIPLTFSFHFGFGVPVGLAPLPPLPLALPRCSQAKKKEAARVGVTNCQGRSIRLGVWVRDGVENRNGDDTNLKEIKRKRKHRRLIVSGSWSSWI